MIVKITERIDCFLIFIEYKNGDAIAVIFMNDLIEAKRTTKRWNRLLSPLEQEFYKYKFKRVLQVLL